MAANFQSDQHPTPQPIGDIRRRTKFLPHEAVWPAGESRSAPELDGKKEVVIRYSSTLRTLRKRALKQLSSLPLAIGELFVLAGLSAVGTVIDQNETTDFYQQMYPNAGDKVRYVAVYVSCCQDSLS